MFDHSKDQILLIDPLPSVNKPYSMILKVEKQRMNQVTNAENLEMAVLFTKSAFYLHPDYGNKNSTPFRFANEASQMHHNFREYLGKRGVSRTPENFIQIKEHIHCEHCGMRGHTMATCFKIHGYPDWYKTLKKKKKKEEYYC